MEKKQKKEVKQVSKKEIRLNMDLMNFVAAVIEEKITAPGNLEKIRERYEEIVGLKFTNVARVLGRSNRPALAEVKKNLISEKGLTMEQVKEFESTLKELSKEKGERNYISVQV